MLKNLKRDKDKRVTYYLFQLVGSNKAGFCFIGKELVSFRLIEYISEVYKYISTFYTPILSLLVPKLKQNSVKTIQNNE